MALCTQCQFDKPLGMKYCGLCGSVLPRQCPECSFSKPSNNKLYGQCGHLAGPAASSTNTSTIKPHTIDHADRRQLTVMFCDLTDSALFSDMLDPEEFRNIIRRYQAACAEVITQNGGYTTLKHMKMMHEEPRIVL